MSSKSERESQFLCLLLTVVSFSFSEADYVVTENPGASFSLQITKPRDIILANPVRIKVSPMTVETALSRGVISTFPEDSTNAPNRASDSDFNSVAFVVIFPADESAGSVLTEVLASVSLVDDDINEADQSFIVRLDVVEAMNFDLVDTNSRNTTICQIRDNDGKKCS